MGKSTTRPVSKTMAEKVDNVASEAPKATIKSSDMPEELQQFAVDTCIEALDKETVEKDIAAHVKKTFDTKQGPTWHVVVGKNFGSFVTHETKTFMYAYVGSIAILI